LTLRKKKKEAQENRLLSLSNARLSRARASLPSIPAPAVLWNGSEDPLTPRWKWSRARAQQGTESTRRSKGRKQGLKVSGSKRRHAKILFVFIYSVPKARRDAKKADSRALVTLLTHLGARSVPDAASRDGDEFFPRRILRFFFFRQLQEKKGAADFSVEKSNWERKKPLRLCSLLLLSRLS